METVANQADEAASPIVYVIDGQRLTTHSTGFAEAVATAHATHLRPRCLCVPDGIRMYVARIGEGFIVKRMPNTGSRHAPACPSYEPQPEFSGLGQVLGSAIVEDPATGETTLDLGFSLFRIGGRSAVHASGAAGDSVVSGGTKLSMRGLLHYLWDQAELTRWHPGFSGKRSWATVRTHLQQAADHKLACGVALESRLYIPEAFFVEKRDAILARRTARWASAVGEPGKPQQLMLLIAELKEIGPARYGFKAIVKHLPDQAFALDEQLYRRLGLTFESALALWGAAEDIHMVMIATFGIGPAGIPTITELSLMPVTRSWLPVDDGFEKQLVERLVAEGRSFVKGLRYNLGADSVSASATLTDCEGSAPMLFVVHAGPENGLRHLPVDAASTPVWRWDPSSEAMPSLPVRWSRPARAAESATDGGRPLSRGSAHRSQRGRPVDPPEHA